MAEEFYTYTKLAAVIRHEHVLEALRRLDNEPHGFGMALKYQMVYENRPYDPKAVVGMAHLASRHGNVAAVPRIKGRAGKREQGSDPARRATT